MSKPSTGLTGLTVQLRSLRVSCASRTAASEVKSRTAPPGSDVGRRIWAESGEQATTSVHTLISAFPSHRSIEVSLDPIVIAGAPEMPTGLRDRQAYLGIMHQLCSRARCI